MEENFNQQNKSSVPPPPTPEITIRTMKSDIKSIEQGGGEIMTAPQVFIPQRTDIEMSKIESEINVPGYTGPEKPIFASPTKITSQETIAKKKIKWKFIALIIGILLVLGIFWFLGYYVIFPWIFS